MGDAPRSKARDPPLWTKTKSWSQYRKELQWWKKLSKDDKADQAGLVALSLPEEEKYRIKEKVMDELDMDELSRADGSGWKILMDFLDKHLGRDELEDVLEKFDKFDDYVRSSETISEFISTFDQYYSKIKAKDIVLPSPILAFLLLKKAGLTKEEKLLVISGMNYDQKDELFEQAKKSLRKFKGDGAGSSASSFGGAVGGSFDAPPAIKLEPAYFTQGRSRGNPRGRGYYAPTGNRGNYRPNYGGANSNRGSYGGNRGNYTNPGSVVNRGAYASNSSGGPRGTYGNRGNYGFNGYGRGGLEKKVSFEDKKPGPGEKNVNPIGFDGVRLLCHSCGSFRHFLDKCPDKWPEEVKTVQTDDQFKGYRLSSEEQSSNYDEAYVTEHVVLFTGDDKRAISSLGKEAASSGVLDSACTSTVCGDKWLEYYLESLTEEDRKSVQQRRSDRMFKFGPFTVLNSQGEWLIPAYISGCRVMIKVDSVVGDVPLLFSMAFLERMKVQIDFEFHVAFFKSLGVKVSLNFTSSGHHCISITPKESVVLEEVNSVDLKQLSDDDRHKCVFKLHRQFGHPSKSQMEALLKDAGVWSREVSADLSNIYEVCNLCRKFSRAPSRPVVSMPMARHFNQKVAMDLKYWQKGMWILHLIDMFSRYTMSEFITRKLSSEVIHVIMKNWIGVFGVMGGMLSDNGGEFNSDEMRDITSVLDVEFATTAAESPWQNGLCERNHAVTDIILSKLVAQYPKTPVDVLLKWSNMAKNTLAMWNGFSSCQLVFGRNPNLPNILTAGLPAMEGLTQSEVLCKHLNALHAARAEFIKSESDERLRRALRHKVRATEERYVQGDKVFYKKEGELRWLGPATVLGQDGQVVFVRHGGGLYRISPCRLVRQHSTVESEEWNQDSLVSHDVLPAPVVVEQDVDIPVDLPEPVRNEVLEPDIELREPQHDHEEDAAHGGIEQNDDDFIDTVRRSQRVINKELGCEVYMVSIPRNQQNSEECMQAKMTELKKLQQFGVYDVVDEESHHCISTRWVLWKKGDAVRARLVARGFEENMLEQVDSPTVGKCGMRILLVVSASRKWQVQSIDIKSAFLQGNHLERDVYLRPPREAKVVEGKIWKLNRALYGLNDAARKFYDSVVAELVACGCVRSQLDPSLFWFKENGKLCGVLVSHIDDFLFAGTVGFMSNVIQKLCRRFQVGKFEEKQFRYVGYQIKQDENGIVLDQCDYVDNIQVVPLSAERERQKSDSLTSSETTQYRSLVGSLNWIVQGTRPDLAFCLVELSTKFQNGTVADLLQIHKVIQKAKMSKTEVKYPVLDPVKSWFLVVSTDASHGNLCDGTGSCGGYVLFLVDSSRICCPIVWRSNKIDRVVRSTIAAEMLSAIEGIEEAVYVKEMFLHMLGLSKEELPIIVYVDHKGAVESVYSTRLVKDRRLRIDIAGVKECLEKGIIKEIRVCSTKDQLADCLTKKGSSGEKLRTVLMDGVLPPM